MIREKFLKENHPAHYGLMLVQEKLYPHCREIQGQAQERMDTLMEHFITNNLLPDKAADGLAWTAHMDILKSTAKEIFLAALS